MLINEPVPILCIVLTEKVSHNLFCCLQTRNKPVGDVPTPSRFAGVALRRDDGNPFDDKMTRLVAQLREQQAEAAWLDKDIEANLQALGFRGSEA